MANMRTGQKGEGQRGFQALKQTTKFEHQHFLPCTLTVTDPYDSTRPVCLFQCCSVGLEDSAKKSHDAVIIYARQLLLTK